MLKITCKCLGEPPSTPPAALFCRINFLRHFFPVSFVHFDFHDRSALRLFTSRKTPPEIIKNTTTNSQTRSDCLILLIARLLFNILSGISTTSCLLLLLLARLAAALFLQAVADLPFRFHC